MNVDEAMETAAAYLAAYEQEQEPLFDSEEVAITLAAEVERLRVWKTRWKDAAQKLRRQLEEAGDGDTWRRACRRVELELEKTRTEVKRLQKACNQYSEDELLNGDWRARAEKAEAELAAAKAATKCPVKLFWCYESNGCDIVISGMSDEDSTKFGNWLNQRMKDTTPPTI